MTRSAARHAAIRQVERMWAAPSRSSPTCWCAQAAAAAPSPMARATILEDTGSILPFRDLGPRRPGDARRVQLHPTKENLRRARSPVRGCWSMTARCPLRVDGLRPPTSPSAPSSRVVPSPRTGKGVNVPDVVGVRWPRCPKRTARTSNSSASSASTGLRLSFVQRRRRRGGGAGAPQGRAPILSKIEKPPAAVQAFDEILATSDGDLVARGDLGVELPVHAVPPIQKRLVRKCRTVAKPVIVATQMLESMIESPMPTPCRGLGRGHRPL